MGRRRRMLVLLASMAFWSLLASVDSQCKRKPVVFNFGDSNSDTGEYCLVHGIIFGPPTGRAFFGLSSSRLCDGRLMIDFLCESLEMMSYLTPYMQSVGPNFTNGANFAVSGSATLPEGNLFNLDVQVAQFLQLRASLFRKNKTEGSIGSICEEDFGKAVYIMDIGQNDLAAGFTYLSYPQLLLRIPSFISQIRTSILKLYQSGGKNFWVHNTGPLGCLPQILAVTDHNETDVDAHGCLQSRNNAANQFNQQLYALCEKLRSELKDATIVYVDVYSIKYGVISNSALYGFEHPFRACCGAGGAPFNYQTNHTCGGTGSNVCEEGAKFISWDGVHYTEAANALFASEIISANHSTPRLEFRYFCNT